MTTALLDLGTQIVFDSRESNAERGAFADRAFDSYSSVVLIDDFFARREAQAGAPFPTAVGAAFGGKEWLEDFG